MRTTRVEKFKKYRQEKRKKFFFFAFLLPSGCILAGYLITSLFILPSLVK